jgi:hypothetical protein
MVPMQGNKAMRALHEPKPEFPLTPPTPLPKERGTSRAAFVGRRFRRFIDTFLV